MLKNWFCLSEGYIFSKVMTMDSILSHRVRWFFALKIEIWRFSETAELNRLNSSIFYKLSKNPSKIIFCARNLRLLEPPSLDDNIHHWSWWIGLTIGVKTRCLKSATSMLCLCTAGFQNPSRPVPMLFRQWLMTYTLITTLPYSFFRTVVLPKGFEMQNKVHGNGTKPKKEEPRSICLRGDISIPQLPMSRKALNI